MNPDFDPSEQPPKGLDTIMAQTEIAVESLTNKYNVVAKLFELNTKIKHMAIQLDTPDKLSHQDIEMLLADINLMKQRASELDRELIKCEEAAEKDKKLLRALLEDRINNSPYAIEHSETYPIDFGDT